jgi:hypothetical protein
MMTDGGMLHAAQRTHDDSSTLRWGGLAGISGSVLLVVVFAIVGIFAGPEPAGPAGPISRFPEIRVARTVENGLYLAVLALWVSLALALFQGPPQDATRGRSVRQRTEHRRSRRASRRCYPACGHLAALRSVPRCRCIP